MLVLCALKIYNSISHLPQQFTVKSISPTVHERHEKKIAEKQFVSTLSCTIDYVADEAQKKLHAIRFILHKFVVPVDTINTNVRTHIQQSEAILNAISPS